MLQVVRFRSQEILKSERIKLVTEELHIVTSDNQRLQLDKQMLMTRIGELTAICKTKEAAMIQLEYHIKDTALPKADQASIWSLVAALHKRLFS